MAKRKQVHGKKKKKSAAGKSVKGKLLSTGQWFEKLVAVQKRLRAPDGCPWDREQTHSSLRTYLIEEAYEVLEALEDGNDAKFAEEMGDLLLQILFHSQIASEEDRFTIDDVIREIHDKMVRRHPHVFGDTSAKDSAEVLKNWEQIKKEERREKNADKDGGKTAAKVESLLDGLPKGLPAALEAYQLTRRASRIGFDWDNIAGVLEKLQEESSELSEALTSAEQAKREEEVGDLLFAAVNVARFLEIDPEIALKNANKKFSSRFRQMEQSAEKSGRTLANVPRPEMEELWNEAKRSEKSSSTPGAKTKR